MDGKKRLGFTLVEVMIVIVIIGLLITMVIPSFYRARTSARRNVCINNMRLIEAGKYQWAVENNKATSDTPSSTSVASYITGGLPNCPEQGEYTVGPVNSPPSCGFHGPFY